MCACGSARRIVVAVGGGADRRRRPCPPPCLRHGVRSVFTPRAPCSGSGARRSCRFHASTPPAEDSTLSRLGARLVHRRDHPPPGAAVRGNHRLPARARPATRAHPPDAPGRRGHRPGSQGRPGRGGLRADRRRIHPAAHRFAHGRRRRVGAVRRGGGSVRRRPAAARPAALRFRDPPAPVVPRWHHRTAATVHLRLPGGQCSTPSPAPAPRRVPCGITSSTFRRPTSPPARCRLVAVSTPGGFHGRGPPRRPGRAARKRTARACAICAIPAPDALCRGECESPEIMGPTKDLYAPARPPRFGTQQPDVDKDAAASGGQAVLRRQRRGACRSSSRSRASTSFSSRRAGDFAGGAYRHGGALPRQLRSARWAACAWPARSTSVCPSAGRSGWTPGRRCSPSPSRTASATARRTATCSSTASNWRASARCPRVRRRGAVRCSPPRTASAPCRSPPRATITGWPASRCPAPAAPPRLDSLPGQRRGGFRRGRGRRPLRRADRRRRAARVGGRAHRRPAAGRPPARAPRRRDAAAVPAAVARRLPPGQPPARAARGRPRRARRPIRPRRR